MTVLEQAEELRLKGSPIGSGIAIGTPFIFYFSKDEIPEFSIPNTEVENEVQRYRDALERSRRQVIQLQKQLELDGAFEGVMILETHLQIMQDDLITIGLEQAIRKKKKNAEYLFQLFIRDY